MTAPADTAVEVVEQPEPDTGEIRVRLPVVVIEGMSTSDGRYLTPGGITHRALPISLLACPENAHGGQDPAAAQLIGRIDTLTRHHGPDILSPRTGEPFPDGVFVWSGEGAIQADHPIADMVRRRYLRGVSVDLAGMDVELVGEDEAVADGEDSRRRMVAHSAEIAAATLVVVPAFSDAYIELADDTTPAAPITAEELPEGLVASVAPAWRSAEVGDYPTLTAAGEGERVDIVSVPDDAAEQLAEFIAAGEGEQRDASELASAIIRYIGEQWATGDTDTPVEPVLAAAPSAQKRAKAEDDGDTYPGTDRFPIDTRERAKSAIRLHGSSDLPAEKVKAWLKRRLKAKGWDDLIPESWSTDSAALAAEPAERADDMGKPDAPQTCEYGDHPAERSLIYRDGERYAATCTPDEDAVREWLAEEGETVTEVVEIKQADEVPVSSRTADRA